jgi:hypothetical protein
MVLLIEVYARYLYVVGGGGHRGLRRSGMLQFLPRAKLQKLDQDPGQVVSPAVATPARQQSVAPRGCNLDSTQGLLTALSWPLELLLAQLGSVPVC